MINLQILISSFNRSDLTVRAIELALRASSRAGASAQVWLYDDGSSDGTVDLVNARFNDRVRVLEGDGSAFWAKSMARAEHAALNSPAPENSALVWLNDDVDLDEDAFIRILAFGRTFPGRILIGSMRDPETSQITYGGFRRAGVHPLSFQIVEPSSVAIPVDTLNGNLVFVPVPFARAMGGIDGSFAHAWADVDYGLRAKKLGNPPLLLPGTFGACSRNPTPARGGLIADWRSFTAIKGAGNPSSTRRLLKKASPKAWPLWWLASYGKWWLRRAVGGR